MSFLERVFLRGSDQVNGREDRIRTCDIWYPKPALYQAELLPVEKVVARDGFEPPTQGFSIPRSTD